MIFLTVIYSELYCLCKSLSSEAPSAKTVEVLFEILQEHLKPQPILIFERYKSYCGDQRENETISDYTLRKKR